jgi:hypothetical protein
VLRAKRASAGGRQACAPPAHGACVAGGRCALGCGLGCALLSDSGSEALDRRGWVRAARSPAPSSATVCSRPEELESEQAPGRLGADCSFASGSASPVADSASDDRALSRVDWCSAGRMRQSLAPGETTGSRSKQSRDQLGGRPLLGQAKHQPSPPFNSYVPRNLAAEQRSHPDPPWAGETGGQVERFTGAPQGQIVAIAAG